MRSRFLLTLLLMLVAGLASFLAVRYNRSPAVLAGERKAFFVKMYARPAWWRILQSSTNATFSMRFAATAPTREETIPSFQTVEC